MIKTKDYSRDDTGLLINNNSEEYNKILRERMRDKEFRALKAEIDRLKVQFESLSALCKERRYA